MGFIGTICYCHVVVRVRVGERIMELPGHVNCQGSGPGQWILGGGGNSVGRGPKTMETVCQDLAFTRVIVRSGLGSVGSCCLHAGGDVL